MLADAARCKAQRVAEARRGSQDDPGGGAAASPDEAHGGTEGYRTGGAPSGAAPLEESRGAPGGGWGARGRGISRPPGSSTPSFSSWRPRSDAKRNRGGRSRAGSLVGGPYPKTRRGPSDMGSGGSAGPSSRRSLSPPGSSSDLVPLVGTKAEEATLSLIFREEDVFALGPVRAPPGTLAVALSRTILAQSDKAVETVRRVHGRVPGDALADLSGILREEASPVLRYQRLLRVLGQMPRVVAGQGESFQAPIVPDGP